MKKYYCFAGVELELELPAERANTGERHLAPFGVDGVEDPHRFTFTVVDALTPPAGRCVANEGGCRVYEETDGSVRYIGSVQQSWEPAYLRVAHRGREHHVQLKEGNFPAGIGTHTVLTCLAAEHLVAEAGGFVFHSSYIHRDGRAILFTAPSGTGKSTQAALWERYRGAEIINGDRSAVRIVEGEPYACGIPFAGSSEYCKNRTLPLQAIVYLKQAPVTSIRRLRGAEAFRRIWEGCSVNTWDREDLAAVSETVQRVVMTVPVYELACTPDESAITALEGVLQP